MYCLFGTKWCKLHLGPLWSIEPTMQQTEDATNPRTSQSRQINDVSCLPHDVKVCGSYNLYKHDRLYDIRPMHINIPGLHERTLRRDISSSVFTTGAGIQVS